MASPWTNDDSNTSRKRTPSLMRKTVKIKSYENHSSPSKEFQEYKVSDDATDTQQITFESIEDVQKLNENRNTKIGRAHV